MYTPPLATVCDLDLSLNRYRTPRDYAVNFKIGQSGLRLEATTVPGLIADIGTPWNTGEDKGVIFAAVFGPGEILDGDRRINSNDAGTVLDQDKAVPFKLSDLRDIAKTLAWEPGTPQEREARIAHSNARKADLERIRTPWIDAAPVITEKIASPFHVVVPAKDRDALVAFYSVDQYGALWRRQEHLPQELAIPETGRADFGFLTVRRIPGQNNLPIAPPIAPHAPQPKDSDTRAPFTGGQNINTIARFPWGPAGQRDTTLRFEYPTYTGPITDPGDLVIAIERETYLTMNTVNVKRVSDNTPIDMQDLTISLDADSWAWKLTAQVFGTASMALIEPDETGLTDVEVEINGHIWIFMIESYSGDRKHADHRFTVAGVSKTQELAAPYAPERSASYPTTIQADQIIDDELTGTGYSVTWNTTPSWAVEGGSFSFQNLSPIALAKRIADAAGAILVPSKADAELTLKPRFRISPWALDTAVLGDLDAQIPLAMVSQVSLQYTPAPLFDSVYISGTTKGVATIIELNGSGGVLPAPDVFDDLMTDTDVNAERGRQEIAGSGNMGLYTLTLPVPEFVEAPGLLEPGMVIEAVEGNVAWRGYVLGTSIKAPRSGAAKVEQTTSIVRFYEH